MLADKTLIKVSSEYSNYANIFLLKAIIQLSEHTKINIHIINIEDSKQPTYELIYSLKLVELKTLTTYIEINLKSVLIWFSKSFTRASIFFVNY